METLSLAQMTLEQKVGQLFMMGFREPDLSDHARTILGTHHVGNVVLFRRNVRDRARLQRLNADIQALTLQANGAPAFIAADQEGGMVSRLCAPYAHLPGAMACGAGLTPAQMETMGVLMGEELRDAGLNMNYAPVFDVNNNPRNPVIGVRSFGDDPARVAAMGTALYRGMHRAGVVAVGKHFPGHGDTASDSHLTLPAVTHDRVHVEAVELPPFRHAVDAGIPALMTAHILYPALGTGDQPATLSPAVLTDLLREQWGFSGLVLTDCLQMQAIADACGTPRGCVLSLLAGADIVLVCHDLDVQIASVEAVLAAVRDGELSEALIDERAARVLAAKAALPPCRALTEADLAAHRAQADAWSAACVTLARDRQHLLPLRGRIFSVSPRYADLTIADGHTDAVNFAQTCAERLGGAYVNFDITEAPDDALRARILAACAQADTVVLGSYSAVLFPAQAALMADIVAVGKPVVLCALRLPYDAALHSQAVGTALCTYDYTQPMVDALVRVLAGEQAATASMPVRV